MADRHIQQVAEIEAMTNEYLKELQSAHEMISDGCYYAVAKDPWLSKIWRHLGFRRAWVRRSSEAEGGFAEGYIIVGSVMHFDWKDRLRILISGRVQIEHAIKTDVAVLRSLAETDVAVLPPWASPCCRPGRGCSDG